MFFDPTHRSTGDVALAFAVAVVMVLGTSGVSTNATSPDALGWALLVAAPAALTFRRRWPVAVMWTSILVGLVYTGLGNPGGFYTLAMGVGIFTVAAAHRRRAALAGLLIGFGLFLAADLAMDLGHLIAGGGALWFLGWLTVAFLLGEVARSRSDYIGAVQERAAEEERSRQEQALRRVGEERMEIARELHDVLAHSISIITVQAGAALHHLDTSPEQTREALTTVRQTGKRALSELRSSIEVLRRSDAQKSSAPAPTRPSPGLEDLKDLAQTTRLAGLEVNVVDRGTAEVPAPVGLAAYRIVQESLTNVARHAGASTATVLIDLHDDRLLVRVDDDGRGASPGEARGHGIDGMRERARALDGELTAGSRPEGGFRVEARLPLATNR